jgi:hypothetical protein
MLCKSILASNPDLMAVFWIRNFLLDPELEIMDPEHDSHLNKNHQKMSNLLITYRYLYTWEIILFGPGSTLVRMSFLVVARLRYRLWGHFILMSGPPHASGGFYTDF